LAQDLANHFNTTWVPEYSREYLEGLNRAYTYDDVLTIAQGQLGNENRLALFAENYLFVDTELIINKIWCEYKWHTCHQWILDRLQDHHYDLYLLTYYDLPWEFDPLRENPTIREELFEVYQEQLEKYGAKYFVVKGMGDERFDNALGFIEKTFQ
ncbi:MAG TPA: ATP-binding protein, partial [Paludibacter sp.]